MSQQMRAARRLIGAEYPLNGPEMTFERAWEARPRTRRHPVLAIPSGTAVRGITIRIGDQWSEARQETRWTPTLRLGVASVDTRDSLERNLVIAEGPRVWRTLREAWAELVHELAQYRGFRQTPPHWLRACPHPERFEALRLWMRSGAGGAHRVPKDVLDPVRRKW